MLYRGGKRLSHIVLRVIKILLIKHKTNSTPVLGSLQEYDAKLIQGRCSK